MREFLLILDVISAVGLVVLVLLQQGRGADLGAAFGAGASATLFGARGSANFMTRATAVLATVFFASNLGLAWWYAHQARPKSIMEQEPSSVVSQPAGAEVPMVPGVPVTVPSAPAPSAPGAPASVPEVPK